MSIYIYVPVSAVALMIVVLFFYLLGRREYESYVLNKFPTVASFR